MASQVQEMAALNCRHSRNVRGQESELYRQKLNTRLSHNQNHNYYFFAGWHLQFLEDVLEDVGHLGACSIEEEEPRHQTHVQNAEKDANYIDGHAVAIKANDMSSLAGETHAAEEEAVDSREEHAQNIKQSKGYTDDLEVVGEASWVGYIGEDVMNC